MHNIGYPGSALFSLYKLSGLTQLLSRTLLFFLWIIFHEYIRITRKKCFTCFIDELNELTKYKLNKIIMFGVK